jgi:hypothetical protein
MLAFCTRNTRALVVLLIIGSIITLWKNETAYSDSKLAGWADRLRGHSSQPQSNNKDSDSQLHGFDLFDAELRWDDMPVPPTRIVAHAPGIFLHHLAYSHSYISLGWTVFDRLYVLEGTIIVVTDSPELIPNPKEITSKGQKIQDENVNLKQLEPTEQDFKVISTEEAKLLFGPSSIRIGGISVSVVHLPYGITAQFYLVPCQRELPVSEPYVS